MSLSFVTKAIQTTAADGTFEEQAVDNGDDHNGGSTRGGNGIGLFDQLRQNMDEEEAARLEFQRSIMRGTLALDEDDAAHLQQLQQQKEEESLAQERFTETQLASFRVAQAERFEHATTFVENKELRMIDSSIVLPKQSIKPSFAPTIKIKKRRRDEHDNKDEVININSDSNDMDKKCNVVRDDTKDALKLPKLLNVSKNPNGALSTLLSGYYSSDEND